MDNLNKYLDFTLLSPTASTSDIEKHCHLANEIKPYAICIPNYYTSLAKPLLSEDIKICTVLDFPLGNSSLNLKTLHLKEILDRGIDEVDMVLNQYLIQNNLYDEIVHEISTLKNLLEEKTLKVIVETCLLNEQQKLKMVELLIEAKADFIKTSTGFSHQGANLSDIKLFKENSKNKIKIKASGGIKSESTFKEFLAAGADRIGASWHYPATQY